MSKNNVQILQSANDWKEAIRLSVNLLEKDGYVSPEYKEVIIQNVEANGPYIVLAPNIALPHARPDQGVIKSQIAITLFREAVYFNQDSYAKLFVTLAAADRNSHLDALIEITNIFQDEEKLEEILNAADAKTLYKCFNP